MNNSNRRTSTTSESNKLPNRLFNILNDEIYPNCIWWIDNGTRFVIEKNEFSNNVMEKEFNNAKFKSFIRSLTRWGFKRCKIENANTKNNSKNNSIYENENFKKNSPELIKNMLCRRT